MTRQYGICMFEKLDTYIREFISLSQTEWHKVTGCFQPYFLNKNDYLIQAGNVCNYVYFINSGGLRMFYIEPLRHTFKHSTTIHKSKYRQHPVGLLKFYRVSFPTFHRQP